jgi:hypothetical protein
MRMGARKTMSALVLTTLLLAACGGGAGDTATTAASDAGETTSTAAVVEETTTTVAPTTSPATETTTAGEQAASIEDIPAECVAEIAAILQVFEPAVEGIDWETATIMDHIQVMTSLSGTSIGDTPACEENVDLDVSEEEGVALFLEVAEQEAPGAVGYFAAVMAMNEALGERQSTGDCQTDIATFEEVVAGGVPFVDLPLPEQWLVLNLMGSIGFCNLQTQGELISRPEVGEFLAGSPFG